MSGKDDLDAIMARTAKRKRGERHEFWINVTALLMLAGIVAVVVGVAILVEYVRAKIFWSAR